MRELYIYTEKHPEAMTRFFPEDEGFVYERGKVGGTYICVSNRQCVRARLQSLMEYIIMSDNPALADSEKAFDSVTELVFNPARVSLKARLEEFLRASGVINIEGYINFRMSEYAGRVNFVLYSIIKNKLVSSKN